MRNWHLKIANKNNINNIYLNEKIALGTFLIIFCFLLVLRPSYLYVEQNISLLRLFLLSITVSVIIYFTLQ